MLWLVIPLVCIAVVLGYLLIAPLIIEVDSDAGLYRVKFHRLARVAIRMTESSLIVDMNIAGWRKEIDLLAQKETPVETLPGKTKEDKKRADKKRSRVSFRKSIAVLRSFRVNRCFVNVDTGDMPANGLLYPVFFWLSMWTGKALNINFSGENVIKLDIRNRVGRILWAYIKA